jgi:hypothetical protein
MAAGSSLAFDSGLRQPVVPLPQVGLTSDPRHQGKTLIGTGTDHFALFVGYLLGAAVMILGAVVELVLGINAEGRSLEDIAQPLGVRSSPHLSNVTGAPRPPAARTILEMPTRSAEPATRSAEPESRRQRNADQPFRGQGPG